MTMIICILLPRPQMGTEAQQCCEEMEGLKGKKGK